MATPKQLVELVAEVTGVPLATVIVHDRNLLAAGLRTEGTRGRGKSNVTFVDAARLILAVSASRSVKDSALTAITYGNLSGDGLTVERNGLPVSSGPLLEDTLATLMEFVAHHAERFSGSNDSDWIKVSLFGPNPKATIQISQRSNSEVLEELSFRELKGKWKSGDLEYVATLSHTTLGHAGVLVAGEGL